MYVAPERASPKKFGAEATNTVVFVLHRPPTKAVNVQTPFEDLYGYKPLLKNLKTFDWLYFSHMPQPKSDKSDKKIEQGIVIIYNLQSKDKKNFNHKVEFFFISRDVEFLKQNQ